MDNFPGLLDSVLSKEDYTKKDLHYLIGLKKPEELEKLYKKAYEVKEIFVGKKAYYRGLIEFSNRCIKDCYYCGIRLGNKNVERFDMTRSEILEMAEWAYENRYGSLTLQSGERQDEDFVIYITKLIKDIKKIGNGSLGLTLCLGEQTEETYKKWFDAGGHRYLLRIETTNKELYKKIHPDNERHSFERRKNCLKILKKIGYQVGTGVMIGLPGQTEEDMINDIYFFKEMDIVRVDGDGESFVLSFSPGADLPGPDHGHGNVQGAQRPVQEQAPEVRFVPKQDQRLTVCVHGCRPSRKRGGGQVGLDFWGAPQYSFLFPPRRVTRRFFRRNQLTIRSFSIWPTRPLPRDTNPPTSKSGGFGTGRRTRVSPPTRPRPPRTRTRTTPSSSRRPT